MRLIRTRAQSLAVIAILGSTLCASQVSTCAEIWIDRGDVHLKGTITKDDPARFRAVAATIDTLSPSVRLDSDGGDVFAAMDIGRQIRAKSMRTNTYRCVSACVFIYAGGVSRYATTSILTGSTGVGIHRPYNTDTGITSLGEADKRYKQLDSTVRAYFKEMNVSDGLADDMLRIQPQDVKFLTRAEAERYGLVGDDPSYADLMVSRSATYYGISKQDYFRREKRVEAECPRVIATIEGGRIRFKPGASEARYVCEESILRGIAQKEFSIRRKREHQCDAVEPIAAGWECRQAVYRGER
jgi:ATP-dependent protease ClpP protease subunit